jgi:hypothetical protein
MDKLLNEPELKKYVLDNMTEDDDTDKSSV